MGDDFLLVIPKNGAPGYHLQTLGAPIACLSVLAPEIFPSHGGIPVVFDGVFGTAGNELGDVCPPIPKCVMGHHQRFLFFRAPARSL